MVGKDEICKVGDFGLLREIPKDATPYVSTSENCLFPVRWMAPESLEDREFSPASDVWSFGVILWEMKNPGAKPYGDNLSEFECGLKIIGGLKLALHIFSNCSKDNDGMLAYATSKKAKFSPDIVASYKPHIWY